MISFASKINACCVIVKTQYGNDNIIHCEEIKLLGIVYQSRNTMGTKVIHN